MSKIEEYLNGIKEQLYSESTVAKIWGVARPALERSEPPTEFPEYSFGKYTYRDIEYWTCGYFPGSLYALLERAEKYPNFFPLSKLHPTLLEFGAKWWSEPLKDQSTRVDTHDIGFIIEPSFQREYERSLNDKSMEYLVNAANALASRFNEKVGAIRSWDVMKTKNIDYNVNNEADDSFLVIIDNMCNIDLLYYVASKTGDLRLSSIATTHALTTLEHQFRHPENWSCYHVVNYNKHTGNVKQKFTNQGYSDESMWSRGLAWAVMGYAETYGWTKQDVFLNAATKSAEFFISELPDDGVPAWDFRAPDKDTKDVSAGLVAALGMLKLYEYTKEEKWLLFGLKLTFDIINFAYQDDAFFRSDGSVNLGLRDTILLHSTTNNNPAAHPHQIKEHGLVYADYYFLCIGNKLLELGLYK